MRAFVSKTSLQMLKLLLISNKLLVFVLLLPMGQWDIDDIINGNFFVQITQTCTVLHPFTFIPCRKAIRFGDACAFFPSVFLAVGMRWWWRLKFGTGGAAHARGGAERIWHPIGWRKENRHEVQPKMTNPEILTVKLHKHFCNFFSYWPNCINFIYI